MRAGFASAAAQLADAWETVLHQPSRHSLFGSLTLSHFDFSVNAWDRQVAEALRDALAGVTFTDWGYAYGPQHPKWRGITGELSGWPVQIVRPVDDADAA